jgi:hypothetical protein
MILSPTLTLSAGSGAAIARPTFSRDFAGEKTLNNGTGPAITFTRASNATFFDANGTLQTASNDTPRFDHDPADGSSKGLLIEEARTNSIRNSQAGGAANGVIGSGTVPTPALPTHWGHNGLANNVSGEVMGTGTENGLAYVDLKISGTPSATASVTLRLENTNHVVGANAQTWTNSAYVKLQAGSLANTVVRIGVQGRDASGVLVSGETTQNDITPTGSALAEQRYSVTRTMANAGVERVMPYLLVPYTSGQAIDLTLRIAAPQLEQGAFPTSYIPTTSAAVTRSADSAVVTPISLFYNQAEGTLFAEASRTHVAKAVEFAIFNNEDDAPVANFIALQSGVASPEVQRFQVSGAAVLNYANGAANTVYRMAGAYAANDFIGAQNGTLTSADTSGTVPTVNRLSIGMGSTTAVASYNGAQSHIRRIAYWPKRLSNALLQSLTA